MPAFHETLVGRKFYEKTLPALVEAIDELRVEVERLNENLEERDRQASTVVSPKKD